MKILLVSDSHGYDDELKKVLENVKCDLKIHCGDSCFDENSPFIKEFAAIVDGNPEINIVIDTMELYEKQKYTWP